MLNVVLADTQISVMYATYHYLFWRPVSAIDPSSVSADGYGPVPGVDDGSSATVEQAGWRPLVATPNHPEYPAAHGCASSSAMEVVRDVYGNKNVAFDFTSTVTGTTHHFQRTEELLDEIHNARVWGGMHFRTSVDVGMDQGKQVARWMTQNYFRPVD